MINKKILFAAWASKNKNWYTYQAFDKPLRKIFRQVVSFDPQEEVYNFGKEHMNQKFIEVIKRERPDYIFLWIMHDEFYMETLIQAKKLLPKSIIFCYNGDDDYKFENHTIHFFPLIDYFMTTQPDYLEKYKKYGKESFFSCGADTKEFKSLNLTKKFDVSFVGTPKSDRVDFIRELSKNKINFAVGGANWEKYPEFKEQYIGWINNDQFIKLINESKINICLSKNYIGGTHILERFFQINACKSFCLAEYARGYFPLFKEGKDISTFKNKEEMIEKIKYYLKHEKERESLAKLAYEKTIKSFDIQNLLKDAITYMERNYKEKKIALEPLNKKIIYLSNRDLAKGKEQVKTLIEDYDYVCFKDKRYEPLAYKDYFQMHSLELTKKDISCVDIYYNSLLIGDYASIQLNYAFDLKDKHYFYNNLNISQLMVRKSYFLDNFHNFLEISKNKPAKFINRKNTVFISIPFLRTRKRITQIPFGNIEHIFFAYLEGELLKLKNQNKLFRNPYIYKLLFYSIFVNPSIGKYIFLNTIKRSKNKKLIKISELFNRLF